MKHNKKRSQNSLRIKDFKKQDHIHYKFSIVRPPQNFYKGSLLFFNIDLWFIFLFFKEFLYLVFCNMKPTSRATLHNHKIRSLKTKLHYAWPAIFEYKFHGKYDDRIIDSIQPLNEILPNKSNIYCEFLWKLWESLGLRRFLKGIFENLESLFWKILFNFFQCKKILYDYKNFKGKNFYIEFFIIFD